MIKDEIQKILRELKEAVESFCDDYQFHAGRWHNKECAFPRIDQAVCNCDLPQNSRVATKYFNKQIKHSLTTLLQSQIKRLEERKRTDETQMNEDHIYDDCLQETIDEYKDIIKEINK